MSRWHFFLPLLLLIHWLKKLQNPLCPYFEPQIVYKSYLIPQIKELIDLINNGSYCNLQKEKLLYMISGDLIEDYSQQLECKQMEISDSEERACEYIERHYARRRWRGGRTCTVVRKGNNGFTVASTLYRASSTALNVGIFTAGLHGITGTSTPRCGGAAPEWSMVQKHVMHRPSRKD